MAVHGDYCPISRMNCWSLGDVGISGVTAGSSVNASDLVDSSILQYFDGYNSSMGSVGRIVASVAGIGCKRYPS